jgi:hypothetical protein
MPTLQVLIVKMGKFFALSDNRNREMRRRIRDNSTGLAGGATNSYYSTRWQVVVVDTLADSGDSAEVQYVWSPYYVDELILRG